MSKAIKNRVVVTGIGAASILGATVNENWSNMISGKKSSNSLPQKNFTQNTFNSNQTFKLANAIAEEAFCDADLHQFSDSSRVGCVISTQQYVKFVDSQSQNKLLILQSMPHLLPAMIAQQYKIKGYIGCPGMSMIGGAMSIGEAYRLIKDGYQDIIISGGIDSNGRFSHEMKLLGALSSQILPYDQQRNGTSISDGGALMIMESLDSAIKRNSKIYCEIVGFATSCDADHVLRPQPQGDGLLECILQCLQQANLTPSQISHFNSHATGTIIGDSSEAQCIKRILGSKQIWNDLIKLKQIKSEEIQIDSKQYFNIPSITANKSHTGHMVNAAGAIESVFSALTIKHQIVPAILNLDNPLDDELRFSKYNLQEKINVVIKNAVAFGGINAAIIFKKF